MTAITTLDIPSIGIPNSTEQPAPKLASKIQSWLGHGVSVIGNGIAEAAKGIAGASQKTLSSLNLLVSDAPAVAGVFRKLDHHVLRFLEQVRNANGSLTHFQSFLNHTVAFIDFTQLISETDYVAMGRFKEQRNEKGEIINPRDENPVIGAKLSFLTADIGGALMWFQEMGFFKLSNAAAVIGETRVFSEVPKIVSYIPVIRDFALIQKIAAALGELRVFSFVKNLSCRFVTLRALDLGYACFAVDAGRRLLRAANTNQKISAGLDLSSFLAELTLSASLVAGATNVVGLGIGGTACIGLAVSSFLYRAAYADQINQKVPQPQAVTV